MAVTEQLTVLAFADGTSATVSWVLDMAGGTVQSLVYAVPTGHEVAVQVSNGAGAPLWTRTVVGNGLPQTVTLGVSLGPKQAAPHQIAFWGN